LIACTDSDEKEHYNKYSCKNVTTIQSIDSTENFLALVNSNHLYYLKNSYINHLDKSLDNWNRIDSNIIDSLLIIKRFRGCDSNGSQCLNIEKYTLWENKIISFEGVGSGYMADIDFQYDKKGRIHKYIDVHTIYKFFYFKNILKEVVKFEKDNGNEIAVEKFTFTSC
jgi:hypothetical protein